MPNADIRLSPDDRPTRPTSKKKSAPSRKQSGPRRKSGGGLFSGLLKRLKKPGKPRATKSAVRRGGGKKGKRRFGLKQFLGWTLTLALWGMIAIAGVVIYYCHDLPDLSTMASVTRRPSVTLLDASGRPVAAYGDVYGEVLDLKDISPWLPSAVLATEDRRFYSHFAFDPIGLARAVVSNIRAKGWVQGGSTITQQLAKNLFLTPERSLKRKIQELVTAIWLESKFTKEQILTLYLNRVYLGSGSWGVDAAARRYFDASARNLNLYQSALLAGLLKAPSRYNPQNDQELSYKRTSQVLLNMVAVGDISQEQANEALRTGPQSVRRISHTGRYFADWTHDQVAPYTYEGRDIVVRTTLDMALQEKVDALLDQALASLADKNATQGAVVVMTPDGAIRAMSGGRRYAQSQFNRAVQSARQPGSAFKPVVWLTAVERGWRPDDMVQDSPVVIGKYRPSNYGDKYEGPITLRYALAKSSNSVAVRLIEEVGPRTVAQTAKRLGISSEMRPEAALALGASEVNLLELTGAYAIFANGGFGAVPHAFQQIYEPGGGGVLYQRSGSGLGQVISRPTLAAMTDMMSAVITGGTGRSAAFGRPAAGKSGTTQDYRDAWFIGFTANYVCGVWLGNDNNAPMKNVTGGAAPAKLWREIMMAAHQGIAPSPLPGSLPEAASGGPVVLTPPSSPSSEPAQPSGDTIWDNLVRMLGG